MGGTGSSWLPAERGSADHHAARLANRNKILRTLISRGPATRAELARRTGLSRPTVSVIVSDLLDAGIVTEGERVSSGGAPGTLLQLAGESGVTVVADLRDVQHLTLGAVAADGEVLSHESVAVASTDEATAAIVDSARQVKRGTAIGVTLAVPGLVDAAGDWIANPTNPIDTGIVDRLRKSLAVPVLAVGAAAAAAVSDLRDSPEDVPSQLTLVVPDASAGLILDGSPVIGSGHAAGDFAHVVPGGRGPRCPECGRTCLLAFARAVGENDSGTNRRRLGTAIAAVLAPVVAAVDLQQIVLAQLPAATAEMVVQRTASELAERLPADAVPVVRVSQQGATAALVGAAAITLFSRLD